MSNGTGRKKPSPGPSCEPARPVLTAARHSESPHCLSVALPRHTVTCTSFGPWHFFSCLHIPFTLKNLTEETFWKVPIPLCVPGSLTQRARQQSSMAPWWFPPAVTAQARNCQGSQHMQFLWKRSVGREEKKERPICAETVKLRQLPPQATGCFQRREAASWGHSVYT